MKEIQDKGYDLSINKYKEIEREKVEYEASAVIMERIVELESEIQKAILELKMLI